MLAAMVHRASAQLQQAGWGMKAEGEWINLFISNTATNLLSSKSTSD